MLLYFYIFVALQPIYPTILVYTNSFLTVLRPGHLVWTTSKFVYLCNFCLPSLSSFSYVFLCSLSRSLPFHFLPFSSFLSSFSATLYSPPFPLLTLLIFVLLSASLQTKLYSSSHSLSIYFLRRPSPTAVNK